MPLRITLDAFSGVSDPGVTLGGREADELLKRLAPAKRVAPRQRGEVPESLLGYRGLRFEQLGEPQAGLPPRFRLAGGLLTGPKLRHVPADEHVEDFICGSDGPLRPAQLDPELLDHVRRRIVELRERDWVVWPPEKIKWPVRPTCACAPLYEPDWWNDGGQKQLNNNCYNYASDYRSDTFAQPGRATGQQYPWPITCAGVRPAAERDALIDSPNHGNKCPKEGHLVALVVAPGPGFIDFHWYRRGRNGRWTHKPGSTPVTNVDNSGHLITDPRTADRGPYTDFCTFMVVMHGHIKIG